MISTLGFLREACIGTFEKKIEELTLTCHSQVAVPLQYALTVKTTPGNVSGNMRELMETAR
eukprot:12675980-Prorocentrum_lima.AAC.1